MRPGCMSAGAVHDAKQGQQRRRCRPHLRIRGHECVLPAGQGRITPAGASNRSSASRRLIRATLRMHVLALGSSEVYFQEVRLPANDQLHCAANGSFPAAHLQTARRHQQCTPEVFTHTCQKTLKGRIHVCEAFHSLVRRLGSPKQEDGSRQQLITPPLDGTILPGVTPDSILQQTLSAPLWCISVSMLSL